VRITAFLIPILPIFTIAAAISPGFAQQSALNSIPAGAGTPNVLHVRVIDLRNSKGTEICTLYGSAAPEAFPSDDSRALANVKAPIQFDAADCTFRNLAPGEYALVTFHDENNNGQFDRDALGLPKEEYGFSNNLKPEFEPPKFKDAAFEYKGGNQWLTIKPAN
jgi:uncharacterized protein (DUF2141 family)